jgi:hypothetical protein
MEDAFPARLARRRFGFHREGRQSVRDRRPRPARLIANFLEWSVLRVNLQILR